MVRYTGAIFSVVLEGEVEANREYIDANHLNGILPDEVLLNGRGERVETFDEVSRNRTVRTGTNVSRRSGAGDPTCARTFGGVARPGDMSLDP